MAFAEEQSKTLVDYAKRLAQEAGPNTDFFKAFTARTSSSKRCCDSGLSLLG